MSFLGGVKLLFKFICYRQFFVINVDNGGSSCTVLSMLSSSSLLNGACTVGAYALLEVHMVTNFRLQADFRLTSVQTRAVTFLRNLE